MGVGEGQGAHVCLTLCPLPCLILLSEAQVDKKVFPYFSPTQNIRAIFPLIKFGINWKGGAMRIIVPPVSSKKLAALFLS